MDLNGQDAQVLMEKKTCLTIYKHSSPWTVPLASSLLLSFLVSDKTLKNVKDYTIMGSLRLSGK